MKDYHPNFWHSFILVELLLTLVNYREQNHLSSPWKYGLRVSQYKQNHSQLFYTIKCLLLLCSCSWYQFSTVWLKIFFRPCRLFSCKQIIYTCIISNSPGWGVRNFFKKMKTKNRGCSSSNSKIIDITNT